MSGQIFISYRREESRWLARSLHDRLAQRFDRDQIFMDVDSVGLGEDFVKTIEETVGSCDVLIAVIGTRWLTSADEKGHRRLDNPEDFVRMEIATALRRHIRVIPVLVDGASMPLSTDLPDDLKLLVRRNALQVAETHFDDNCRRLVVAIEQVLEKAAAERREREEKERLEHKPQAQLSGPVALSEADKPSAETRKVVYPLAPKPPVSAREKPPTVLVKRNWSPSKQVIAFLAIAAVLMVGGLIYLAIRTSQSRPSPSAIATPSFEDKSSSTPVMAVPPSTKQTQINISGTWRDATGSVFEVTQQGNSYKFTATNSYYGVRSWGQGTINGRQISSEFQTDRPSEGTGTGTISDDGNKISGTVSDSKIGQYVETMIRSN
jgi:hypothetical protein